ncbi:cytochrome b/b6 domain-containing protein [Nitratireductor indicus]|uniref:Cytochrome B561 n=1 Tax=Nitratireductor indicus C115 TaxID=1231190 RepID=K2PR94_9HYPH|nr:cytochrome b/b6 domain-containing protein [Nitratireductor indicus]EKF43552.1 cytochrome B561 [Nitratireductor indicus C115]MDS1135866.1 cytochrome b/b6 domain-containing protein [Nitratireductor indicus]SFQ05057.1 Cytochrome b [Nitratireductor indicus]
MSDIRNGVEAGGSAPPAPAVPVEAAEDVRVWDPLVRLFHWLLVAAFITAWVTGDELKSVHIYAGYTIIGLLAVRVLWGLFGSTHARFSDFIYHPATTLGYLADMVRLRARRYLGHNPAGGMMVLALIGMLSAITATGYMMTTDAYWGVQWVQETHETLVNITLVLIGLHLAGVAFASLEHRENLVKAMITGRKRAE